MILPYKNKFDVFARGTKVLSKKYPVVPFHVRIASNYAEFYHLQQILKFSYNCRDKVSSRHTIFQLQVHPEADYTTQKI